MSPLSILLYINKCIYIISAETLSILLQYYWPSSTRMYKKIKYVQALLQCSELFLSSIVPSSRNVSLSFFPKTDAKKCTISQLDYARQVMTVFLHSNPAWLSSFLFPFALLLASRWRWWLWTTSRPKPLRVERCRTLCNEVVEPLWGQLVNLIACRDTVVTLLWKAGTIKIVGQLRPDTKWCRVAFYEASKSGRKTLQDTTGQQNLDQCQTVKLHDLRWKLTSGTCHLWGWASWPWRPPSSFREGLQNHTVFQYVQCFVSTVCTSMSYYVTHTIDRNKTPK